MSPGRALRTLKFPSVKNKGASSGGRVLGAHLLRTRYLHNEKGTAFFEAKIGINYATNPNCSKLFHFCLLPMSVVVDVMNYAIFKTEFVFCNF